MEACQEDRNCRDRLYNFNITQSRQYKSYIGGLEALLHQNCERGGHSYRLMHFSDGDIASNDDVASCRLMGHNIPLLGNPARWWRLHAPETWFSRHRSPICQFQPCPNACINTLEAPECPPEVRTCCPTETAVISPQIY
jgi:hypothetical protein